jgi:hypothetical protein
MLMKRTMKKPSSIDILVIATREMRMFDPKQIIEHKASVTPMRGA